MEFLLDPSTLSFVAGSAAAYIGLKVDSFIDHGKPFVLCNIKDNPFDSPDHELLSQASYNGWKLHFHDHCSLAEYAVLIQNPLAMHLTHSPWRPTHMPCTNTGRAFVRTFKAGEAYCEKGQPATQIALVIFGSFINSKDGRTISPGQWVDGHWLRQQYVDKSGTNSDASQVVHDVSVIANENPSKSEYENPFLWGPDDNPGDISDAVCLCWSYETLREIEDTPKEGFGRLNGNLKGVNGVKIANMLRGTIANVSAPQCYTVRSEVIVLCRIW